MAKATLKERFVDGPARSTQPVQRNVRACTLTAIVATNATRIMDSADALVERDQVGCALASLTPAAPCADKVARPCLASFSLTTKNATRHGYDVNRPLRWSCMTPPRPHGDSDGIGRGTSFYRAARGFSGPLGAEPSNRERSDSKGLGRMRSEWRHPLGAQ